MCLISTYNQGANFQGPGRLVWPLRPSGEIGPSPYQSLAPWPLRPPEERAFSVPLFGPFAIQVFCSNNFFVHGESVSECTFVRLQRHPDRVPRICLNVLVGCRRCLELRLHLILYSISSTNQVFTVVHFSDTSWWCFRNVLDRLKAVKHCFSKRLWAHLYQFDGRLESENLICFSPR